ncbi:hypothetical protein SAMN05443246_5572 [Paenibacillus sp. GP183]|nr:hypothetical protein SAMN05443246_5572 [Paenibacillus sp. GP183]
MILSEINAALTYLLNDNNESIIITDNDSVYAADVIFYLSQLFSSLKCDYRVHKITDQSYEVVLYQ